MIELTPLALTCTDPLHVFDQFFNDFDGNANQNEESMRNCYSWNLNPVDLP
jgi:hypothetical protein